MFAEFSRYIFGRWKKSRGLTHDDFVKFDVAYEEALTMFDQEKVLVQDGNVVAKTAIVDDQQNIEPIVHRLPEGYATLNTFANNGIELIVPLPTTCKSFNMP